MDMLRRLISCRIIIIKIIIIIIVADTPQMRYRFPYVGADLRQPVWET